MEDLIRAFREIDDGLRLVVALKSKSWAIEYRRDDLVDEYSAADFEKTYRSHMANQVSSTDMSRVIKGGAFRGQLYLFEGVIVFQFPTSRYEGLYVSYDWYDGFPIQTVFDTATSVPLIDEVP